jgi:hypothetical protein
VIGVHTNSRDVRTSLQILADQSAAGWPVPCKLRILAVAATGLPESPHSSQVRYEPIYRLDLDRLSKSIEEE